MSGAQNGGGRAAFPKPCLTLPHSESQNIETSFSAAKQVAFYRGDAREAYWVERSFRNLERHVRRVMQVFAPRRVRI
jgi:hypothetical protein